MKNNTDIHDVEIGTLRHVTNAKSWGRKFQARLIEPGIISYKDCKGGVGVVKKETIDRCANSFIGRPLIISHTEVSPDNMTEHAVGYISNVFYNEKDGWHYCEGVVHDEKGQDEISKTGRVSCAYKCHSKNNTKRKTYHCIPYDYEITEFVGEHVAIVNNPRYEEASILLNSKSKPMNLFKLFKKAVGLENKAEPEVKQEAQADNGEVKTVENAVVAASGVIETAEEVSGESTVEIEGEKIELAALANAWSANKMLVDEAKKASAPAPLDGESEVQVGEEKVKLNSLIANYEKVKADAAEARKVEEAAKAVKAKNFQMVMNASSESMSGHRPKTLGTEEEAIALGKKLY